MGLWSQGLEGCGYRQNPGQMEEEQGDHPVWKTRWQEMQQWMEAVVDTPGRKRGMEHGRAPRGPG